MLKISFSDFWGGYDPQNNFWTLILDKLSMPYEVVQSNPDLLISSCFGNNWTKINCDKRLYWTGENWFRMNTPISNLGGKSILDSFDKVYSFDYDNSENHYRLPLYLIDCIERDVYDLNINYRTKSKDTLKNEFKEKKFCTFVQGNGNCQFRNQYFQYLMNIEKVDSFGHLFNNTGIIVDRSGKIEKTKNYKFALAFENSEYDGYVSEKIIDAFKSDIIPIYWGGSKINQEFNNKSFIDVNTLGIKQSIDLIKELNSNFDTYWEYYSQQIISKDQPSLLERTNLFLNNFKTFIKSI